MNFLLLFFVLLAVSIGVVFIYGSGHLNSGTFTRFWIKQLVWIGLGTALMLAISCIDYENLGRYAVFFYSFSIGLLVIVLIFGKRINGAKSWLGVLPGLSIQPSEFAKLGLLIAVSWLASRPWNRLDQLPKIIPFAVLTIIPLTLIALQPDLGSAIVLIPIALSVLFVSGAKKRWFVSAAIITILAAPLVYKFALKDHQRKRLYTFIHPTENPTSEGWNARQSLLAVGSGGLYGKGYMKGTQNVLGFLPKTVAPTDFIFSVIAEEIGFIGSAFLIFVFGGILVTGIYIASKARDYFGRNLACGITTLLCVHIYINIGMTIGLAPIIGIPLPFVSYGGSFMLSMLGSVGILQSVYIHRQTN